MADKFRIRDATVNDAAAIRNIYAPFVQNTVTTFEYQVPSLEVMQNRITLTLPNYPYLVAEDEVLGSVLGYSYANQYKEREGYNWIVESSIYLSPSARGKGIGTILYGRLFDILTLQGFYRGSKLVIYLLHVLL